MTMKKLMQTLSGTFASLQNLALLAVRLVLAYGFFGPAIKKVTHFPDIIIWFRDSLGFPFPELNALLATGTECLGVLLLLLGLCTRFIALPLMVIMVVATVSVHGFAHFAAQENGFEIPLYYFVMLLVLLSHGAGKYSLDKTLLKNKLFGL
jgi:putative oxidoreductase